MQSENLWAYFGLPPGGKSIGRRYWNAFGIGKPTGVASIDCEINPPIQGISRRPAGAFATLDDDIILLHRGAFNAFRGRIPREFMRANLDGTWVVAQDGDRETDFLQVGSLSSPSFVSDLAEFVKAAAQLKAFYKGKP